MDTLTIALPKGKLFDKSKKLLEKVGISAEGLSENSRKLVISNPSQKVNFIITKTVDLPTYIEYGAADIGIIGKDVLLEEKKDVYELLDLGFGKCRLVLAAPEALLGDKVTDFANMRVATKYPFITTDFFHSAGVMAEVIKLNGSIELAPMVGLSELIADIVETGTTLKENKLRQILTLHDVSARFIVNRVSFKLKFDRIKRIVDDLTEVLKQGDL